MSKTVPFSSEASMSVTGIFVLLHSDMMNGDLMLISLTFFPPASSRTALMKDFVSEVWLSSPKSHRTNRSCVGLILFRASSFVRRCFFCFCPMYDSLVSAYEYRGDRLFYAFSRNVMRCFFTFPFFLFPLYFLHGFRHYSFLPHAGRKTADVPC